MNTLRTLLGILGAAVLLAPAPALAADCAWVMSWARADGYEDTRLEIERRASRAMTVERALDDSGIFAGTPEHAAAREVLETCYALGYADGVRKAKSFGDKLDRAGRFVSGVASDAWLYVVVAWQRVVHPEYFGSQDTAASGSNVARDAATATTPPTAAAAASGSAAGAGTARE